MRTFKSGATRNDDKNRLDYEGFINPLVEKAFAEYMHEHRIQADGELRASDNWQAGIPKDAYMKSLCRHFQDLRLHHRGYRKFATEKDIKKVLSAIRFNIDGYFLEVLNED